MVYAVGIRLASVPEGFRSQVLVPDLPGEQLKVAIDQASVDLAKVAALEMAEELGLNVRESCFTGVRLLSRMPGFGTIH